MNSKYEQRLNASKKMIPASKRFNARCRNVVEKILPPTSFLYKILYLNATRFQAKKRNARKKELRFQIGIVGGCNLNCAGCITFSPLRSEDFIDVDLFEKDIRRVAELTSGVVESVSLMGGEPLMHPNITTLLKIARKYIKIGEVAILTNGILLAKQSDEFWEICKLNRVKIGITPYPINLDYDRIVKKAEEFSVELEYALVGLRYYFNKRPLDINGNNSISENFKKCVNSNCAALYNGKMYTCAVPSYVNAFNNYFEQNFKISKNDYVDIYKANTKDELLDFLHRPLPFCKYCDVNNMQFGIPWRVSRKEINEWM